MFHAQYWADKKGGVGQNTRLPKCPDERPCDKHGQNLLFLNPAYFLGVGSDVFLSLTGACLLLHLRYLFNN